MLSYYGNIFLSSKLEQNRSYSPEPEIEMADSNLPNTDRMLRHITSIQLSTKQSVTSSNWVISKNNNKRKSLIVTISLLFGVLGIILFMMLNFFEILKS